LRIVYYAHSPHAHQGLIPALCGWFCGPIAKSKPEFLMSRWFILPVVFWRLTAMVAGYSLMSNYALSLVTNSTEAGFATPVISNIKNILVYI
jgi:hypothetical protein